MLYQFHSLNYFQNKLSHRQNYRQLWVVLGALLLALLLPGRSASAFDIPTIDGFADQRTLTAFAFPLQITIPDNPYTDDLVVDHDDTLEGDVAVLSGDVHIKEGGEIVGTLFVFSGDIEIDAGGRVDGDVVNLSGDVEISGKISGDLAVLSGDVELKNSGWIGGDISILSGEVDSDSRRDDQVEGDIHIGPTINLSAFDSEPEDIPNEVQERVGGNAVAERGSREPTFLGRFFSFIFRLLSAGVGMIIIAAAAGFLARSKPVYLESVRRRLRTEMVANFVTGFLFNIVLGVLVVIFAITLCLIPMSLISGGVMLAVNSVGWAAVAAAVGRRVTGYTDVSLPSVATVVLGALVLTAPFAFLWSLDGGCVRFLGLLSAFSIASLGAGSVLSPWIKRLSSDGNDEDELVALPSG